MTAGDASPPLPEELQLEVTGACNLRCRMCLVSYQPTIGRRRGSVTAESLRLLLDDLPSVRRLSLQGLGEPLLAPELAEMIAEAKRREIEVGFNTNGMLLDEARADRLVELGVDWVHVSLDAAHAEVFEQIRQRAKFERVVNGIRAIVAARARCGQGARPFLQINAVLMRRTLGELVPLVELAADLEVDRLWVQQLSHDLSDAETNVRFTRLRRFVEGEVLWGRGASSGELSQVRVVLDEARAAASRRGLTLRLPELDDRPRHEDWGRMPCEWPWHSTYVNHDGRVQPCCMVMGSERATMGNAFDDGFPAVWSGDAYQEFRAQLLSESPPAVCRGCAYYRRTF
jgi:radical SAM protein with 4Fe4S-binding SPASM domain